MVEGARLEIVYAGDRIEGSNPSLSARRRLRLIVRLVGVFLQKKKGFEPVGSGVSVRAKREPSLSPPGEDSD